jgi:hypothetical protein
MDIIFDIDGTLADATHRLHFIKDMAFWTSKEGRVPTPDWDTFLSDEMVSKDAPIPQTWQMLTLLLMGGNNRIYFITGRPEAQRQTTYDWLTDTSCPVRSQAALLMKDHPYGRIPQMEMRTTGDRRPSHIVKEERLQQIRFRGANPTMVFEDRADDTAMWRRNGLLCCQVAEGNY